ncbi:MAG: zinc ribbon domain-containing protein, partial [Chloroflexota bacterium]|nr:zinc ribbon domain-containing protein [Chloroflexota bacterium]
MTYIKPLPVPDPETRPFWEGAKRHELLIQQCVDCGAYRFYPRSLCPKCTSDHTRWVKASGKGKIYSFSIVYRPPAPAFQNDTP